MTGAAGALGFGMAVKHLSALDTAKWLIGRVQVTPNFSSAGTEPLLTGWLKLKSTRPDAKLFDDSLACESRDGIRWCRELAAISAGDEAWFELTPHVDHLYAFYRGPGNVVSLLPAETLGQSMKGGTVSLPKGLRMRISGPAATETFLIVASKQPLPALAELSNRPSPAAAELDQVAKSIANDPNTFVVYVEIPHS